MPVRQPSFALTAAALIVILVAIAADACAERSADEMTVTIPQQFQLSGTAQPVSTGDRNAALTGNIQIVHTSRSSFLYVPADVVNGARLTALQDPEAGIVFRNNTIALPVYSDSGRTAGLILATEDMMADKGGYLGRITGARLEIPAEKISTGGHNFSGGVSIFLKDLTEGISYRTSVTGGEGMADAIDIALIPAGLSSREVPVAMEIDGADQQSRSAIEFMIVSLGADAGWAESNGENITVYQRKNETAIPLSSRMVKGGDDTIAYQAVVLGPGTFALAAAGQKQDDGVSLSLSGLGDMLILGTLLAMLISVLIIMLRRVTKK